MIDSRWKQFFLNSSINFFRLILRATVWHRCHPLSAIWSSWNICSLETIVWRHFRLTFSTKFACHWRHLVFPEINLTLFLVLPCKNVQLFLILTWDTIRYRKVTEPLYNSFMYSLVSHFFFSRIYPLTAMHSLLVSSDVRNIGIV